MWVALLARIYGVFALQCSWCGGRVHLVGFITERATVRQVLQHVGERTTAPTIAAARLPPLALNGQQLAAPEWVFEAITELEFDQMSMLAAEAGRDLWTHPAGADAEPIPELEFYQAVGLCICAAEMVNAAERGWWWFMRWQCATIVVIANNGISKMCSLYMVGG